jgi:hypothetical protein
VAPAVNPAEDINNISMELIVFVPFRLLAEGFSLWA